jgi:hypothetical protein
MSFFWSLKMSVSLAYLKWALDKEQDKEYVSFGNFVRRFGLFDEESARGHANKSFLKVQSIAQVAKHMPTFSSMNLNCSVLPLRI